MRRGIVIAFAILGLAACGRKSEAPSEGAQGTGTAPAPAAAPAARASAAPAAKPDVSAGANQDAASCLDLVASEKYGDAVPVCTRALNLDPANEKVKSALETATEKMSAGAGAAGAAAEDATDAAKQAIPKSY